MLSNRDAETARQRSLARFLRNLAGRSIGEDVKRRMVKGARSAIARGRIEGLLTTLEGAFRLLPLETCLAILPILTHAEQVDLQRIVFGKIVNQRRDARRKSPKESQ